jgi:hypothetical protein
MLEEMGAHDSNGTWERLPLGMPRPRNVIKSKWVFDYKLAVDGTILRYKARLVGCGYSQLPGVHYDETYAPVVQTDSLRLLLALAAEHDLELHTMDVVTAYLNAEVAETIYMEAPAGVAAYARGDVVRLRKALYGLKQAGRNWHEKLRALFLAAGFIPSAADPCIFIKWLPDSSFIFVAVHVDDLIIVSNSPAAVAEFKQHLTALLKMKDLGPVQQQKVLGLTVTRDRTAGTIEITQTGTIDELAADFAAHIAHPSPSPWTGAPLCPPLAPQTPAETQEAATVAALPYRELVGRLGFIAAMTRPDIIAIVRQLQRYQQSYGRQHWEAALRVLGYLLGTAHLGLRYNRTSPVPSAAGQLTGYADADYGGCPDTRRSTSGVVWQYNGCTVSWRSKRQSQVATSATQAEYQAAYDAFVKGVPLQRLLHELGAAVSGPMPLLTDNQGCRLVSGNRFGDPSLRHIGVKYHAVREAVEAGLVRLFYIAGRFQPADLLTKRLPLPRFRDLTFALLRM